jgi:hypothetical protein
MLVQIYEVTSGEEASALTKLGVDHIGVLVGRGSFPVNNQSKPPPEEGSAARR